MPNDNQGNSFFHRFASASHSEQGLIIGGILGPIYAATRGWFGFETVPLIGGTSTFNLTLRVGLGMIVGRYYGDGIGNRLGECIDVWKSTEPMTNRLYLMRVIPILMGMTGLLLLSLFDRKGGKPIFDPIDELSSIEMYLFTFLYGTYIGASLATREGRALDLITDNTLVADCGLTRLFAKCKPKAKLPPASDSEPMAEGSDLQELLSPSHQTVVVFNQNLPRRRLTHEDNLSYYSSQS